MGRLGRVDFPPGPAEDALDALRGLSFGVAAIFTVKRISNGEMSVFCCLSYDRRVDRPSVMYLRPVPGSGGETEIELLPDDEVYIQNQAGKTVDMIRPTK